MKKEDIRGLQLIQLGILKEFDRVCRDNGITYFVGFGTLLGAVRHKGFIPWDMDIDVLMFRDQYEKMLALGAAYENCELVCERLNEIYHTSLSRMVSKTFSMDSYEARNVKEKRIYIDILALEYLNYEKLSFIKLRDAILRLVWRVKLYRNGWIDVSHDRFHLKHLLLATLSALLPRRPIFPDEVILGLSGRADKPTEHCSVINSTNGFTHDLFLTELFREAVDLPFEDMIVAAPVGYERILLQTYSDYLTPPPPEDKRYPAYLESITIVNNSSSGEKLFC
ncbi:LPS cholinephosphotransferase [Clostridia bacterium]|nr:LPS cholinephosphotransferase [Clostridia bacterium]